MKEENRENKALTEEMEKVIHTLRDKFGIVEVKEPGELKGTE